MVVSILKTFLFILSSLCASVIIHQAWKSFRLWRRWGLGLPGETHPLPFPLVAAQGQTSRHTPAWFIGAFKASSSAARLIYTVLSWQLLTLGNTAAYCKLATKDNGFYHSMTYSLQSLKSYSHSEIHLGDLRNIYSTVRTCDIEKLCCLIMLFSPILHYNLLYCSQDHLSHVNVLIGVGGVVLLCPGQTLAMFGQSTDQTPHG